MRTCIWLAAALACSAQDFSQRGFLEANVLVYPQTAPNDRAHVVAESLLRYEAFYKPVSGLQINGGIDLRADTHRQVERGLDFSWWDRTRRRPAVAVRRLSASYTKGRATLEIGKQIIRWGKADILNPTDRFAPRDYLNVVENEFLGVTAARLTYGSATDTIDLVWAPRFTPSRVPLLDQRWAAVPADVQFRDAGARFPGGSQVGGRWNHIGRTVEYSLSFYDGHNHLPLIQPELRGPRIDLLQYYAQMRMYGGDLAVPLPVITLKAEAAYFTSTTRQADEYVLYVIQAERQSGEWSFAGGYAGQAVTERRSLFDFAPDRGLTRAFLGRAGYTIDTNRSLALETAVRQNGKGVWAKVEYSQAFGQHWRAIAGFGLIRGEADDFLGQYRRNSHIILMARYSF
jgi:hypothetical protein